MKKFLYFLGILALIAGLVSSCSKDEDEGGNGSTSVPQKRLVKKIESPGDIDESILEYEYDDKGRYISYTYSSNGHTYKNTYTHEGNTITKKNSNDEGEIRIYTFNSKGNLESRILKNEDYNNNYVYKYDNKDHLISKTKTYSSGKVEITTYEWENGNVTKIIYSYKSDNHEPTETVIFKYIDQYHPTPIKNAGNLSVLQIDDIDPIYSNMGVAPKNLPVCISYTDDEDTDEYYIEWVLDGDGYPIKMIEKEEGDSSYEYTVEIFWE